MSRTVMPGSIDAQQSSRRIASLTPSRMTYVSLPSNSTVISGSVTRVTVLLLISAPSLCLARRYSPIAAKVAWLVVGGLGRLAWRKGLRCAPRERDPTVCRRRNIKKRPLISHKTAANRTDLCKWRVRNLGDRTNERRRRNPSKSNVRQSLEHGLGVLCAYARGHSSGTGKRAGWCRDDTWN